MENYMIIIPAFNEEKNIKSLLLDMIPYKDRTIIINDGSTDCTKEIVCNLGFKCIDNFKNTGVSKCIIRGIEYALKNNISKVILMDADGQHNPIHIPAFLNKLECHEFVFGCRYYDDQYIPTNKWASNLFAAALYAELTEQFFTDISCGFKGISISDELLKTIGLSQDYGAIYDIVNYALSTRSNISIIPIQAIYDYDELLYTKTKEIVSLLKSVDNFRKICKSKNSNKIEQIIKTTQQAIKSHTKFYANIKDINFWAFPVCEDGFLFQMNPKDIISWQTRCKFLEGELNVHK